MLELQNLQDVFKVIYLVCPICGYSIDVFTEAEATSPVRSKRLKYLTTRDQVCPNCVNTIAKCERIDAEESEIPIIRTQVPDGLKNGLIEFCRSKGYAVATDYALSDFRGDKN